MSMLVSLTFMPDHDCSYNQLNLTVESGRGMAAKAEIMLSEEWRVHFLRATQNSLPTAQPASRE